MLTCAPVMARSISAGAGGLAMLLLAGCASWNGDRLDRGHERLYASVQRATENLDHRYARKDRELLPVPPTPFRIGFGTAVFDRDEAVTVDSDLELDMSLQLPNIQRRARIFITTDDLTEGEPLAERTDRRLRVGARVPVRDSVNFDVGIRATVWPTAFASAKWSRSFGLHLGRVIPFAKTYIESDRGFGVATGVTIDHLEGKWLFRSTTFGDWRRDREATTWSQALVIARVNESIDDTRLASMTRLRDVARGYGMRLAVSNPDSRSSSVGLYTANLLYKGHLRGKWLYWYGGPEVRWERESGWHPDYGIRLGIDVLFRDE